MLIVPERGPSIPDARGWAISVLQQVGASRECEEHGWMRACHRDRHQYSPLDTSAGEASSEVGKVLDSSVPAGWSRMPFRPTGYFHPSDSCGRKPANSCPQAPMPRPSASGRVQSGAHGARFRLLTKKMTDPVTWPKWRPRSSNHGIIASCAGSFRGQNSLRATMKQPRLLSYWMSRRSA